jgi:hypothetical protein
MIAAEDDARERLGRLLVQRRISLAPRYRVRTLFADDVGLHWRLLHDLERNKRSNFTDETLAAVEVAYRWKPGSIARVLAGGDPEPMTAAAEVARPDPGPAVVQELWGDLDHAPELVRRLWRAALPEETRLDLIHSYIAQMPGMTNGNPGEHRRRA